MDDIRNKTTTDLAVDGIEVAESAQEVGSDNSDSSYNSAEVRS